MDSETLARYMHLFAVLHVNANRQHGRAPHKPILLLALLDEIQRGTYRANLLPVTPELVASFRAYWQALVFSDHWKPRMENPFRYLYQDGFWHFIRNGVEVMPSEKPYALTQFNALFDGVRLSSDLWNLLQSPGAVNALRLHLLQTFFPTQGAAAVVRESTDSILAKEAETLKAEAQSRFRIKRVRETNDDGYFVRHALFPRTVQDKNKIVL